MIDVYDSPSGMDKSLLPGVRRGRRMGLMSTDRPRAGPSLDYHLVRSTHDDHEVEGLLVEEFTRHRDFTTSGLHSAGWTPSAGWWSSAPLSRGLRTDPDVLARVVPSARADAVAAYRRLGGGHLPSEAVLRSYFRDHQAFATAPPLRLGPTQPPEGFHERRVYRVLFAKDLRADQVAALRAIWRTTDGGTAGSAAGGHHEEAATSSRGTCDESATHSPGASTSPLCWEPAAPRRWVRSSTS